MFIKLQNYPLAKMFWILWACIVGGAACNKKYPTMLNPVQSNFEAANLIESALDQCGDIHADSTVLSLSVLNSEFIHHGQSLVALSPFEKNSWQWIYQTQPSSKELKIWSRQVGAGYQFDEAWVVKEGRSTYYNLNQRNYQTGDESWELQFGYFPQTYLQSVIKNRMALRFGGVETIDGLLYNVIYGLHGAASAKMLFCVQTGLLYRIEFPFVSHPYGDGFRSLTFENYRRISDLYLPSVATLRWNSSVFGEIQNAYRIDSLSSSPMDSMDIGLFREARYEGRLNNEVRQLAERIFLIENITSTSENWSYNVLFADCKDFVMVMEAPLSNVLSEQVIKIIRQKVGNKQIRYLVQSHHHNDHIGGIRTYIAEGATILSGARNEELFRKIAAAPYRLNPDRLSKEISSLKFTAVSEKGMEIGDVFVRAKVFNLGSNEHTREMLITYFPDYGILFQSDLLNLDEWPDRTELVRTLAQKIHLMGLDVQIIAGVHGKIVSGEELRRIMNQFVP